MSIKIVQVYETLNKQFTCLKGAVTYRENLIEEFLRKTPGFNSIRAKDRIKFVQSIIDNREELKELLDYSIPTEE